MGRKTSFAISRTASRGVQCSPALLVVLLVEAAHQLLEDRAHAMVVEAGILTEPSAWCTGAGLRLMSGEVSFSIRVPRASARDSRGIWLRNSKLSRMSCTFGENPSRYA